MRKKISRALQELFQVVITEEMRLQDDKTYLIFVDRGDSLSEEQVGGILSSDNPGDTLYEVFYDIYAEGEADIVEDLAETVLSFVDDGNSSVLSYEDIQDRDACSSIVRELLYDGDYFYSDNPSDLVRNTPSMWFAVVLSKDTSNLVGQFGLSAGDIEAMNNAYVERNSDSWLILTVHAGLGDWIGKDEVVVSGGEFFIVDAYAGGLEGDSIANGSSLPVDISQVYVDGQASFYTPNQIAGLYYEYFKGEIS